VRYVDLSEEEDNDEPQETKGGKKRGKGKKGPKAKRRRKNAGNDSEEDSDDDGDADFVVDEKCLNEREVEDVPDDPEVIAAKEKKEKERTDMLWAGILS